MTNPVPEPDLRALVTGASSGIGAAFARALRAQGERLILVARRADRLGNLARELGGEREVGVLPFDLAKPGCGGRLEAAVRERGWAVDLLVNSAGFGDTGPFAREDPLRLAGMLDLNARAVVELSRAFLPGMLERKRGRLINVASTAAFQPCPFFAVYAASKAFVLTFQVDGSTFPHTGKITFVDPSFNPQTGTFLIRVTVPNPDGALRPNQYVRARLKGATRPNGISVPQRAVQQGAKGHFVWVVNADGRANLRPITVGDWYGDSWIVTQGLAAGEQVAVDGTLRLAPDAPVKATAYVAKPGTAEAAPKTPPPGTSLVVRFGKDNATLDDEALRLLKAAVPPIKEGPNPIDVTAYAERTGVRAANVELAKKRAAAVRDALVAEGISADRIRLKPPREVAGTGKDPRPGLVELSVGQ